VTKKPKAKFLPDAGKRPRVAGDPASYHRRNPSWRIGKMEMVDPFGWHTVDADVLHYLRGRLTDFEGRTWADILNSKHNHNVNVEDLCKDAQQRLDELKQYDLEQILSLRLSGAERVWGVLAEGVCTLIWWDPKHRVCPSLKG
jgi:hypothetical protein